MSSVPRTREVPAWIKAHENTECGQAAARFALTDRLMEAQECAFDEIEDCGYLSESVADELKLAAWLEDNPETYHD